MKSVLANPDVVADATAGTGTGTGAAGPGADVNHGHPSTNSARAPGQAIPLCSAMFLCATKLIRVPAAINTKRPTMMKCNILEDVICQK